MPPSRSPGRAAFSSERGERERVSLVHVKETAKAACMAAVVRKCKESKVGMLFGPREDPGDACNCLRVRDEKAGGDPMAALCVIDDGKSPAAFFSRGEEERKRPWFVRQRRRRSTAASSSRRREERERCVAIQGVGELPCSHVNPRGKVWWLPLVSCEPGGGELPCSHVDPRGKKGVMAPPCGCVSKSKKGEILSVVSFCVIDPGNPLWLSLQIEKAAVLFGCKLVCDRGEKEMIRSSLCMPLFWKKNP